MIEHPDTLLEVTAPKQKRLHWYGLSLLIVVLAALAIWLSNQPPPDFPLATPLTINEGTSARDVIKDLDEQNYVRSATWLYLVLTFNFGAENIKAGVYDLERPVTAIKLARLITGTAPPGATVSLTLPEGFTVNEYALLAKATLPDFDSELFISLAEGKEGGLFPDTYEVPEDYSEAELLELLLINYETKIDPLSDKIQDSELTEEEIVNLASIVEREANTKESMRLVAGILSTRLELGMPLQADATMEYVLNKPLNELTSDDLKIDSPYNTYLYKGLPPTPIGNPGLDSIQAVLEPESSDYLFYLTDPDGNFHYAKTYEEHQQNIARYLQ